jgi:hypothetical protein
MFFRIGTWCILGTPKGVNELVAANTEYQTSERTSTEIAIIDDNAFPYAELLRKHDFRIKELGDPIKQRLFCKFSGDRLRV